MKKKNNRRKFTEAEKRKAVDEYIGGKRSADDIATELGVTAQYIYNWRVRFDELSKGEQIASFEQQGIDPKTAKLLAEKDEELRVYKEKVAELSVHVDLLKKLHPTLQRSTSANGYAEIVKALKPSKKPAK